MARAAALLIGKPELTAVGLISWRLQVFFIVQASWAYIFVTLEGPVFSYPDDSGILVRLTVALVGHISRLFDGRQGSASLLVGGDFVALRAFLSPLDRLGLVGG